MRQGTLWVERPGRLRKHPAHENVIYIDLAVEQVLLFALAHSDAEPAKHIPRARVAHPSLCCQLLTLPLLGFQRVLLSPSEQGKCIYQRVSAGQLADSIGNRIGNQTGVSTPPSQSLMWTSLLPR